MNGKKHRFVYGNCVEHSVLSEQVRLSLASLETNEGDEMWRGGIDKKTK